MSSTPTPPALAFAAALRAQQLERESGGSDALSRPRTEEGSSDPYDLADHEPVELQREREVHDEEDPEPSAPGSHSLP